MKILLDTNIIIQREEDEVLSKDLALLLRFLSELKFEIYVHPSSVEELKHDSNIERQKKTISKIRAYNSINSPPKPDNNQEYLSLVKTPKMRINDKMDNIILYSVYKNAVDFLITEDRRLQKKGNKCNLINRVLTISEAIEMFQVYIKKIKIATPLALKETFVYNLELSDPIFSTLISSYPEFEVWWKKISKQGRKAWVYYRTNKNIGAILIMKEEDEEVNLSGKILPKKKRIKISTLIVNHIGHKIGELFIKISVEFAQKSNIDEIYLTHFIEENDFLVYLIEEYGFINVGKNNRGEAIFVKNLNPTIDISQNLSPIDIATKYYPSFYDGKDVSKFIVPIQPEFHNLLYTDYSSRQTLLDEHIGQMIVTGNTIKKAYLCHSPIKKIKSGDILLMYRSKDQELTSIGVVNKVLLNQTDVNKIMREVGNRTVYSKLDIRKMTEKPLLVILFLHNRHFEKPLNYTKLKKWGILNGHPQSITEIDNNNYLKLIDKRIIHGSINVN